MATVPKANIYSQEYQNSLYFDYKKVYEGHDYAKDSFRTTPKLWKAIHNPEWQKPSKGFFSTPKNLRTYAQKYTHKWEWVGDGSPDQYGSWSFFKRTDERKRPAMYSGMYHFDYIISQDKVFEGPRLPDGSIPDSSLIRDLDTMPRHKFANINSMPKANINSVPKANINSQEYQNSLYFDYKEVYEGHDGREDRITPKLWEAIDNPEWKKPPKVLFSKNLRTYAQKYTHKWKWVGDGAPDQYGSWSGFTRTEQRQSGRQEYYIVRFRDDVFEGPRLPDGSIPDSSLIRDLDAIVAIRRKQQQAEYTAKKAAQNAEKAAQNAEEAAKKASQNAEEAAKKAAQKAEDKKIRRNRCIKEFPEFSPTQPSSNWIEHIDDKSGKPYYENPNTDETFWNIPGKPSSSGGKRTKKNKKNKKILKRNTRKY
jgi:hypothetical protein